jgi:hypothetical protein
MLPFGIFEICIPSLGAMTQASICNFELMEFRKIGGVFAWSSLSFHCNSNSLLFWQKILGWYSVAWSGRHLSDLSRIYSADGDNCLSIRFWFGSHWSWFGWGGMSIHIHVADLLSLYQLTRRTCPFSSMNGKWQLKLGFLISCRYLPSDDLEAIYHSLGFPQITKFDLESCNMLLYAGKRITFSNLTSLQKYRRFLICQVRFCMDTLRTNPSFWWKSFRTG